MVILNTETSEQIARQFLAQQKPYKRKIQRYTHHHKATVESVFAQLCPTREADWIDGWLVDLIYSESGYSEPDCILSTPPGNVLGAGLWIITQRRSNKWHEFVVIRDDGIVGHYTIELSDNGDGSCESRWRLVFAAGNENGNLIIEAMPDHDSAFESVVLASLDHFLATGERLKLVD